MSYQIFKQLYVEHFVDSLCGDFLTLFITRYCQYNCGEAGVEELMQYQLPEIEQLVSEAKTVNPDEFREIIWRDENETIPVKQNKVIVFLFFNLFFLKIENSYIIRNLTKLFSNAF